MAGGVPFRVPGAVPTNYGIPPGLVGGGGGTPVTSVTATPPLASSGGTTPDISITLPGDATKFLNGTGAFTVPAGSTSTSAFPFWLFDGEDGEDAFPIPGAKGDPGSTGSTGAPGTNGYTIFLEPDEPELPQLIPGRDGANGSDGATGAQGPVGPTIPVIETDDPEIVPGFNILGHSYSQQLDGPDPLLTPFSPSRNIVIPDGYGWYVPGVLTIAAGQTLTIGATGVLETAGTGSPLSVDAANITTTETTASVTYADLTTVGPSVSVTTGVSAIVWLSAIISKTTTGNTGVLSFAVSGATTVAAADANACYAISAVANGNSAISRVVKIQGLTPGVNTFTAKYRVDGGTFSFQNRSIAVMALTTS